MQKKVHTGFIIEVIIVTKTDLQLLWCIFFSCMGRAAALRECVDFLFVFSFCHFHFDKESAVGLHSRFNRLSDVLFILAGYCPEATLVCI